MISSLLVLSMDFAVTGDQITRLSERPGRLQPSSSPGGNEGLTHAGAYATRLIPPWPADPPVWELRVGAYRVFSDVDEEQKVVSVRAVRRKAGGRTPGEIL